MTEHVGLAEVLRLAPTVAAACSVVVEHLLAQGMTLPSLYLERGGRLRCQAVRGYWQVFDGMPVDAGVIGSTFTRGQATEVRGVAASRDYLAAAPFVVDEVCVPIAAAGRVVGALNVESTTALPVDALEVTAAAAACFARRLVELGGVPPESPAQRLARHAAVLADAAEPEQLWAAACTAAREVAASSSAAVVRTGADQRYHVVCAYGPIGERLAADAPDWALGAVAGWVASGSSCWSLGEPKGCGFPGSQTLRDAGAGAVLVVALGAAHRGQAGFLLIADEQPADLATDVVELLELLGTHAASCARTLESVAALRHQASRDPLTNLGHHGAYQTALAAALGTGPAKREIAVVVLDIDDFKAVNDQLGHPGGDALLRSAARVLSAALRDGEQLYRIGGDEFAAIVRAGTPAEALAVAGRLHTAARAELGATISVGVALTEAAETPGAVTARADSALYEVKRAGRDGVRLAASHVP